MRRIIKFRAWDDKEKVMYEWPFIVHFFDEEIRVTKKDRSEMIRLPMAQISLEQFTGLLDKKGKEIYEGDIVRVYNYLNGKIWPGHVHDEEVVFQRGGFDLKNPWNHESLASCETEVLGNIHQNPELVRP